MGCDVPVEPGWESEVVLGQVQDPRSGIDIDGFVGEAPRGVDRMWLAVLARPPGCGDLVDVAVLWFNRVLSPPVKSGPTSGPLTVSSPVIHVPQGVAPPAQFICVPLVDTQALYPPPWG